MKLHELTSKIWNEFFTKNENHSVEKLDELIKNHFKDKWIKIESADDLPKKNGDYYALTKLHKRILVFSYPNEKFSEETNKSWWLKYVTHYQPIEKPKPPIY